MIVVRLLVIGAAAIASLELLILLQDDTSHARTYLAAAAGFVIAGLVALRMANADRMEVGARLMVAFLSVAAPGIALGMAHLDLAPVFLPFVALALAIMFVDRAHLPIYLAIAWLAGVLVVSILQVRDLAFGTSTGASRATDLVLSAMAIGIVIYLVLEHNRRVLESYEETNAAHESLRDAHEELMQLNQIKTQFMNRAAHELNTPLTPIKLQFEILRKSMETQDRDRAGRSIQVLERNFERLERLVTDVLDGARLKTEALRLERAHLDLSALLQGLAVEYDPVLREKRIDFDVTVAAGLRCHGDALRLHQVFSNLLNNAMKFTPAGGRIRIQARPLATPSRIEVAAISRRAGADLDEAGAAGIVRVSVEDTGIGMDPAVLHQIFDPFQQFYDPNTTKRKGSGLGLFIARGIVEAHDGSIVATSDGPGTGARFDVLLPAALAPPRSEPHFEPTDDDEEDEDAAAATVRRDTVIG